ncbi:hypothetical protein BH20CHL2_BH20CHL2_09870 [soil metagenome]
MRLLCASNLHLGRSTSGVPDHLGLDSSRLSMTAAWDALVDLARTEEVDAVLIAGDLIDRDNQRFEPLGAIERGLTTLGRHDIPVIVVAGDEDVDAVRALAESDTTSALHVLGRDGTWETKTIAGKDGESITIAGWSAPSRSVARSPVLGAAEQLIATAPDVVMLHGTLQHEGEPAGFAPIPIQTLDGAPEQLLIAGAERSPWMQLVGDTVVLSPGSPSALGPLDVDARGIWIADLTGTTVKLRHLPVAAIRFEHVSVDLSGVADIDDAEIRLIGALQRTLDDAVASDNGNHLAAVCIYLTVTGATSVFHELPERLDDLSRTIGLQQRGVALAISSFTNETRPMVDLASLLERADPVGETARLLDALDHSSGEEIPEPYGELLRRSATRLTGVHRSSAFASVAGDDEPDLERAQTLLRREAWVALDALVRQRGIDQEGRQGR